MKNIIITIIAFTLMSCATQKQPEDSLGYKGKKGIVFGYNTVEEAKQSLIKKVNVDVRVESGWTIAQDKNDNSIWSFAPDTHPSYPSVVKRVIEKKNGGIYVRTKVGCGASKAACDKLVKDFIQLNQKIKKEVNANK